MHHAEIGRNKAAIKGVMEPNNRGRPIRIRLKSEFLIRSYAYI